VALKIYARVYFKKYMRKHVYRYLRYYLQLPRRIALPSLGIELEARRFLEYIIIGPAGRSDFLSTIRKLARQNGWSSPEAFHVHVGSSSNITEHDEKA